jgi:hypothetical protein
MGGRRRMLLIGHMSMIANVCVVWVRQAKGRSGSLLDLIMMILFLFL